MIPKILHYIWIGPSIPRWARYNFDRSKDINSGFEVRLHDESSLPPELKDLYDSIEDFSSKSDLLRYSIIQQYGGWYIDIDFFPIRPLDPLHSSIDIDAESRKIIISKQHGHLSGQRLPYANTPIASSPGDLDVIIKACLSKSKDVSKRRTKYGPHLIKAFIEDSRFTNRFHILDSKYFFPDACSLENLKDNYGLLRCGWKPPDAYMAHLWASSKGSPLK